MKTVAAAVIGLDQDLRPSGDSQERPLGEVHTDQAVRRVLALPREVPPGGEAAAFPTIAFTGRDGARLLLTRKETGTRLWLTMTGGEEDVALDEMQAAYRVRAFVEHWGEETMLTEEIRLSPEARAAITDREESLDRERAERSTARQVHRQRPFVGPGVAMVAAGLFFGASAYVAAGPATFALAFSAAIVVLGVVVGIRVALRVVLVVIDPGEGTVRELVGREDEEVCRLEEIRQADVKEGKRKAFVHLHLVDGTEQQLGRGPFPLEEAFRVAEGVNDAIGLPERKRKLLGYRRRHRSDGE